VTEPRTLRELARSHGVQVSYTDPAGRRRTASPDALLAVLRALDPGLDGPRGVAAALLRRLRALRERVLPAVAVAWDGRDAKLRLRLPEGSLAARSVWSVALEDGAAVEGSFLPRALPSAGTAGIDGLRCAERELTLPGPWPEGYHRLHVASGRQSAEALLVSAPSRAYGAEERRWGVFVPVYALHGRRSQGVGDFDDLGRLAQWTRGLGGSCVATLPVFAAFLDDPVEVSPYRPVSRLFWNELFVALERVPELCDHARARELLRSLRPRIGELLSAPDVDPPGAMAVKRRVLELLARSLSPARRAASREFRASRPELLDYAGFRAAHERHGRWETWPARLRDGRLRPGDFDAAAARYHAYVQWIASEQIAGAGRRAGLPGVCLDLPVGAHPDGYDAWRYRESFARGASAGAPADDWFPRGQGWAVPPLHPERSRERGHDYFRACLRHSMRAAGMLRVDHVMSLHRLFWVPAGFEPEHGVYVRYPAEELHAILCLESARHRCIVVGEDLGVVPPRVRPALQRHAMRRTWVLQGAAPLDPASVRGVAVLGTHDMPTFAAFLRGLDVGERVKLGLLPAEEAPAWRRGRREQRKRLVRELRRGGWLRGRGATAAALLRACLAFLAESAAEVALVNLEDLWLETRGQNVPGTSYERANWRNRARLSLAELTRDPGIARVLRDVDRRRRTGGGS
jgi:4-alpha-glucanotransferase